MKPFLFALICFVSIPLYSFGQESSKFKGDGEVFYRETFDWGDTTNERGWTLPDGFYFEDPLDNGFNWHWWPNDSLIADRTEEPPFRSTSAADGHLCLFANLYNNYVVAPEYNSINNSIVFPPIDCSEHSSVILQFENTFSNYGPAGLLKGYWRNYIEISSDYGVHWAAFRAGQNAKSSARPNDIGPGESAMFRINITELAAGQSSVLVRINWQNFFGFYFWLIDDFELVEALDNDIQIEYIDLEWENLNPNRHESYSYMIPQSQLNSGNGYHLFKAGIVNMGEFEQSDIILDLTINKDEEVVFQKLDHGINLGPAYKDTLLIDEEDVYVPIEKGNYEIRYNVSQDQVDDFPDDNERSLFFQVTDSVYCRTSFAPATPYSLGSARYGRDEYDLHANVDHFIGSVFPIYSDCEISGFSVYIMGGMADGLISFRQVLWREIDEDPGINEAPLRLLSSYAVDLDSSMFNKWIQLPLDKDGESEFVKAGEVLWAGLETSDYHADENIRKKHGLAIGSNRSYPFHKSPIVGYSPRGGWSSFHASWRYLMIKLMIKDPSSPVIDLENSPFSLAQNYPNPFSGSTHIDYELIVNSNVSIEVMDLTGRTVLRQEEGNRPAGENSCQLNAQYLVPGLYTYTLIADNFRETKQMIVSK